MGAVVALEVGNLARARVPVRVCDVGGWTDTWFGSPGQVCHLAMEPGVEVLARLVKSQNLKPLEDPLLQAAIDSVVNSSSSLLKPGLGIELEITSAVPAGASVGTSASVLVGIVAAVDVLVGGAMRSPEEIAVLAHYAETDLAGRQAGVQDQWAAAFGGAALLAIGPYPKVRRQELRLSEETLSGLDQRLVTVVFGTHDSSEVHRQVIDSLITCSGVEHHLAREALRSLSKLALDASRALEAGDLTVWGEVLKASVEAQRSLHPALVGTSHERAINVGRASGAVGWKVNGAGGGGGSLTFVTSQVPDAKQRLIEALEDEDRSWQVLDLTPSRSGVSITRT